MNTTYCCRVIFFFSPVLSLSLFPSEILTRKLFRYVFKSQSSHLNEMLPQANWRTLKTCLHLNNHFYLAYICHQFSVDTNQLILLHWIFSLYKTQLYLKEFTSYRIFCFEFYRWRGCEASLLKNCSRGLCSKIFLSFVWNFQKNNWKQFDKRVNNMKTWW